MHNFVKYSLIGCSAVLLCGCNMGGKAEYKVDEISFETEKYSVNGEIITLKGQTEGIEKFNEAAQNEAALWQEDFETRVASASKSETKPTLQFSQEAHFFGQNVISVTCDKYVYISALHGNTWKSARTYDFSSERVLQLSDLFYNDDFKGFLTEKINECIMENPKEYHDLWENPKIDKRREDKFYFDSDKLVIFYEPYELSYYARGVVEFAIPTQELRGYIKEEYLKI